MPAAHASNRRLWCLLPVVNNLSTDLQRLIWMIVVHHTGAWEKAIIFANQPGQPGTMGIDQGMDAFPL
jgi:hypothetical protein